MFLWRFSCRQKPSCTQSSKPESIHLSAHVTACEAKNKYRPKALTKKIRQARTGLAGLERQIKYAQERRPQRLHNGGR